ncbi:uncharacterized protein LOC126678327 [Mercurialis annua]|uniref:uncharacterized protein LOC126678327 n=1 Tax=Mercurialis annua TaxID=3986 RepID=UPI00215E4B1B|nr:uncharacterized protein LOC126678327 [Mercurialis annua]
MELLDRMEAHNEIQSTHLHSLEIQVARLASALQDTNQEGLLTKIEATPIQHAMSIELKGDDALVEYPPTKVHIEIEREKCENSELETLISRPSTTSASVNVKSGAEFGTTEQNTLITTKNNPREQLKAVELRSGKILKKSSGKRPRIKEDEPQVVVDVASSSQEPLKASEEALIEVEEPYVRPPPPPLFVPKVPFPGRLKKVPDTQKLHKFLEIQKAPNQSKSCGCFEGNASICKTFLKDIMNKMSWEKDGTISLTESSSSIIQNDLPSKIKYPGSFTIPCTIGNMNFINRLCDLGLSINLMPLFLFRSLFGDHLVKRTLMVLQLADHSLMKSYRLVEDVLVKVDKFIFPVNFVILDYVVDKECPTILGRPFMNTGRALIDVHAGKLALRLDKEKVKFDMKRVMRNAIEEEECMRMELVEK